MSWPWFAAIGVNYIVWRWAFSVRWALRWIALPLVLAETYSVVDSLLFALTSLENPGAGRSFAGPDRL